MKRFRRILKHILTFLIIITLLTTGVITFFTQVRPPQILEGNDDCVILLHGLGRMSSSMEDIAKDLNQEGYKTVNIDYPSTKYNIETLSKLYLEQIVKENCQDKKIHFVTHSLGGIIVRHYLANNKLENLENVVMLAPPNQGSELADYLKKIKLVRWFIGPALSELGTDEESIPLILPEPDYDVHIIAGNKSNNSFFSKIIPGDDDGKVAVEKTKLKNMKNFLLVPENHTKIMEAAEVQSAVKEFISLPNSKLQQE